MMEREVKWNSLWKLINILNINYYSFIVSNVIGLFNNLNIRIKNIKLRLTTEDIAEKPTLETEDIEPCYNDYNVFVCITMWHENRSEMEQLIESVIRTDLKNVEQNGNNFYEYHVVLDDAFDHCDVQIINEYAETFVDTVKTLFDRYNCSLSPTTSPLGIKENVPYGGRLTWYLPSKARLVLHLKNKIYIKVWKRWSQILYMDYILDYMANNTVDTNSLHSKIDVTKSVLVMVDGDICFSPNALYTLINSLLSNQNLGGVFGKVNGRGNSLWVNYQRFEYVQKHWLERNADRMFGGAICLPGNFCAIKGHVLADPYIQQIYRSIPGNGIRVLELDLTEDRYLSVLIRRLGYFLQKAPKALVESNIPHTFEEYFNQKRRWKPGTIANTWEIIDTVINRFNHTNHNITFMCVLYQIFTIVHHLCCPSIMFLILTHALIIVFNINMGIAIATLLIPILTNVAICLKMSIKIQMYYAELVAWFYAFIMASYLYTIICIPIFNTSHAQGGTKQFITDWLLLGGLILIFVTAAFYNRKEAHFLFLAPVYILLAPSTFISLPLYAYLNINHVFWGTRENATTITGTPKNENYTTATPPEWSENTWISQLNLEKFENVTISLAEKAFWIEKLKQNLTPENYYLTLKSSLDQLRNRFCMVILSASTIIVTSVAMSQIRYDIVNANIGKLINFDPIMSTISGYFIIVIGLRYVATLYYNLSGKCL